MTSHERFEITHSKEYKTYIKALAKLACQYVPKIRREYAAKAFELFANETIRRLVIAYGEEVEKLECERLQEFSFAADYTDIEYSLEDSCLNNARHYEAAIRLFFLGN